MGVEAATFSRAVERCRSVERCTALRILHEHPHWLLADIARYLDSEGPLADAIGSVTIAELQSADTRADPRRELAERATGPEFDAIVLEILAESEPPWVSAGYIRKRAGGPRWKLQAAFRRLAESGEIERRGNTSNRIYCKRGRS